MKNFLLALLMGTATLSYAKQIALTFDDAPRPDTQRFTGVERATRLVAQLEKAKVKQAAFFVNTARLNTEGKARVEFYAKHGHLISNHTHSHPDLNTTGTTAYIEDIRKADAMLSALPNFWRAFRFPFLREGDETSKRDAVRKELRNLGYLNAYVTVDNADYEMDRLFQVALKEGKTVDYEKLREVYLEALLECLEFYDGLAVKVLQRSPKHVLLLHENDLNSLFVGDLVAAMEEKGWTIIAPADAYRDELAKHETKLLFRNNPGRIGEVAKEAGYTGKLWAAPALEEYLAKLFLDRQVFK